MKGNKGYLLKIVRNINQFVWIALMVCVIVWYLFGGR